MSSIKAKNASTGDQVTQYVYGTTLSDSEIASSLLKCREIYPDSTGDSDAIFFEYNRQSQVTKQTDQGGTVHEYDYDKLGRQTHDRVTTCMPASTARAATRRKPMDDNPILLHFESPYHRGDFPSATHTQYTRNAACGDEVTLRLKITAETIESAWFIAAGCMISQAAASMLCEHFEGHLRIHP